MMRTSPVMAFTGTPIYNAYLRLMGAKIGRNVVISSPLRPGLRRHDVDRRQHHPAQGLDRARLSRAVELHPHRPGRDRPQRLRRRSERDRHRHRDGRRHAARPRLVAAERPARAGRQALSRLARGRDDVGLLPDREHGSAARCAPRSIRRLELAALFLVAVPLPILAYHFWDQYSAAAGTSSSLGASRRCRCSASPRRGSSARSLLGLAAVYAIPRLCMMFLQARRHLSDVRLPLPAAEHHPARQQLAILLRAVRRLVVHHDLHALRRLEPEHGRADRLEHGHQPAPRQSVPVQHRLRHDGLRRPVDDQHAHVGDVVPARRSRRSARTTISATTSSIRRTARPARTCCSAPRP